MIKSPPYQSLQNLLFDLHGQGKQSQSSTKKHYAPVGRIHYFDRLYIVIIYYW